MVVPASQVVVVVDSNQFGLMDAAFCLFGRPHVCPSESNQQGHVPSNINQHFAISPCILLLFLQLLDWMLIAVCLQCVWCILRAGWFIVVFGILLAGLLIGVLLA